MKRLEFPQQSEIRELLILFLPNVGGKQAWNWHHNRCLHLPICEYFVDCEKLSYIRFEAINGCYVSPVTAITMASKEEMVSFVEMQENEGNTHK